SSPSTRAARREKPRPKRKCALPIPSCRRAARATRAPRYHRRRRTRPGRLAAASALTLLDAPTPYICSSSTSRNEKHQERACEIAPAPALHATGERPRSALNPAERLAGREGVSARGAIPLSKGIGEPIRALLKPCR